MSTCAICDRQLDESVLVDRETGRSLHAACFVARLPEDLIALAIAAAALVLVPMIVVWAG